MRISTAKRANGHRTINVYWLAATNAVKQWKYRPLAVHGKLVNRIVVVLTFDKNGKVH